MTPRVTLESQQIDFFFKHQRIEFEEVFSSQAMDLLLAHLEEEVRRSLGKKPMDLATNQELWMAGRVLLSNPSIQKPLFRSCLGTVASSLFRQKLLRLAYGQCLFTESSFDEPMAQEETLEEISSISPIVGGALICLSDTSKDPQNPLPIPFHQKKGSLLFFSAKYPIPFHELFIQEKSRYLLLCFSTAAMRYRVTPKDPQTHLFKKLGYGSGDLIQEQIAPYFPS